MNTLAHPTLNFVHAGDRSLEPGRPRWLHLALLAIGLVAWLTFILACTGGPAWSPDSRKILFGWRDDETGRYEVAVFDRATRESRIIFQHRSPKNDDDGNFFVVPAWQNNGTRALVAMSGTGNDSRFTLFSIALKGAAPTEAYDLGEGALCLAPALMPQIGTRMYIGGDDGITWLDLSTGETQYKAIPDGAKFVAEHNANLSTAGMSFPQPPAPMSLSPGKGEWSLDASN